MLEHAFDTKNICFDFFLIFFMDEFGFVDLKWREGRVEKTPLAFAAR